MDNTSTANGGSTVVATVAIVILAGLVTLFVVYGIPRLQNTTTTTPTPTPTPTY